jgi:excisionase family DNA binding protein
MMDKSFTLREAAASLGVKSATLRAQIARGRLNAERRGRDWHILAAELHRYRTEVQSGRPSRRTALDVTIRAIADVFEQTATWPQTSVLQRRLAQVGVTIDLGDVGPQLDPSLGRIDRNGPAILKIRGLQRADARESIDDFELALGLAVERYYDEAEPRPSLSSADFLERGLTPLRTARLREMLHTNPMVTGGGSATNEEWRYDVSGDLHLLGRVESVEGYLSVIDHLTSPRGILDLGPRAGGWPELEARLRELGLRLERIQTIDDVQDIGRRSREIVNDLADVALAGLEPPIGTERFGVDRKAKISAFLDAAAAGAGSAPLRRVVLATYDLSNAVTHSSRGSRSDAIAAAQGVVLLVRCLRELVHEQRRLASDAS